MSDKKKTAAELAEDLKINEDTKEFIKWCNKKELPNQGGRNYFKMHMSRNSYGDEITLTVDGYGHLAPHPTATVRDAFRAVIREEINDLETKVYARLKKLHAASTRETNAGLRQVLGVGDDKE